MKRIAPAVLAACLVVPFASSARGADKGAGAKPAAKVLAVVDSLGLLEGAVARDSTKFENLSRLGVMYLDSDRATDAARVLLKADQVRPNQLAVLVNLGAAFDAMGRPEDAQGYYHRALKIAPDDVIATCRLATSLYSRSHYPEAVSLLRDIIAKNPNAHCAYFTLGVAFADAGIFRDAIRMWKKVVELAPGSPEAVSARESITVLEKYIQRP